MRTVQLSDVQEFLAGKRVVLVGPSPHLMGTGMGKVIDTYDVVCRINDIIVSDFLDDYGTRTDLLFYTCDTRSLVYFQSKMKHDEHITKQLKYVVSPVTKADHTWSHTVQDNFESIDEWNLPFCAIDEEKYNYYTSLLGVEANSGIMSAMMLLDFSVCELLVTGFSFYAQGQEYTDAYYTGRVPQIYQESDFLPWEGHQQIPQAAFFKLLVEEYPSIMRVDSYLRDLLDLQGCEVVKP